MLRITVANESQNRRILLLEGKVAKPWLRELRAEIERGLEEGKTLAIDFSKVTYIDEDGARLINRPLYESIERRNGSLFIRTLLDHKTGGET